MLNSRTSGLCRIDLSEVLRLRAGWAFVFFLKDCYAVIRLIGNTVCIEAATKAISDIEGIVGPVQRPFILPLIGMARGL